MRILCLAALLTAAVGTAVGQPKKGREPLVRGKTVAAWVKTLEGKELFPRLQAVNALAAAGPEARSAVPALVAVFRDKDATLLHPLAAVALARVGPDAVAALKKALADDADAMRGGAALALGMMGEPAKGAAEDLGKMATGDKAAGVRFAAAQALGRIGGVAKAASAGLKKALDDKDASVRVEAAVALWKVAQDKGGLEALTKALDDGNPAVVGAAVSALAEMGAVAKSAAGALKKLAEKGKDFSRRMQAAEAWHAVNGDEGALKAVLAGVAEKDAGSRKRATAALGTFSENPKAIAELTKLLDDKDAAIRREAACSLCAAAAKLEADAVKALLARLRDPDLSVRWWAALALAAGEASVRKDEEEILRSLRGMYLQDEKGSLWTTIQETAAPASRRATNAWAAVLKGRHGRFQVEAARGLAVLGMDAKPARGALVEALKVDDKMVRRAVAEALGKLGGESVPALARMLEDRDAKVREGAARALGRVGLPGRSAVKELTRLLKDDDSGVRTQAALALWHIERDAELALPTLNQILKDVDNKDRWEAADAIGVIAVETRGQVRGLLDVLLNAAKDRDPAVKVTGTLYLYRRGGKARDAAALLKESAVKGSQVRQMALEALGEVAAEGKVVETLTAALEDRDVGVRLAAEEALARGGREVVPELVAALKSKNPKVRAGVARALGMIGKDAKEAAKALKELSEDKDAAVKAAAVDALLRVVSGEAEKSKGEVELEQLKGELKEIEEEVAETARTISELLRVG